MKGTVMHMTQLLASIIFFIVFIQLFIVLSIYLWVTMRDFLKDKKKPSPNQSEQARVIMTLNSEMDILRSRIDRQEKIIVTLQEEMKSRGFVVTIKDEQVIVQEADPA